jgi:pilus assembly protein Flp/PilA
VSSTKKRLFTKGASMRASGTITDFSRFFGDERAATAIEYSLVAAGIGLAVATTVMSLGSTVKSTFYDRLMALM